MPNRLQHIRNLQMILDQAKDKNKNKNKDKNKDQAKMPKELDKILPSTPSTYFNTPTLFGSSKTKLVRGKDRHFLGHPILQKKT